MPAGKGWSRRFDDPIPLPGGSELSTLREAGDYIIALLEREQPVRNYKLNVFFSRSYSNAYSDALADCDALPDRGRRARRHRHDG